MTARNRLKAIVVALGAVGFGAVDNASGAAFVCDGTYNGITISQNVVVPPGANCVLNAATVTGNIEVKSDEANGGGEIYFGTYDGGEGSQCFNVSNVYGNISVHGTGESNAGFGVGGAPVNHCLNVPAILNLGAGDDRANLDIDHASVYQLTDNDFYKDTINVRGNVNVRNSDREGMSINHAIWSINVINTTGKNGKVKKSNMECRNDDDVLFITHSVGGNLGGDGSCFP